ncbi:uncharacterized protein LOC143781229 [Ranitomeya variabilis]|uniref:uncharacterized protein LOC143781229 n=1 Tax=Ranitomeya variabilis TaxID=490064 RepID=UPI004056CAFB
MDPADARFDAQRELASLRQSQEQVVVFMRTLEARLGSPQGVDASYSSHLADLHQELDQQGRIQTQMLEYMTSVDERLSNLQRSPPAPVAAPVLDPVAVGGVFSSPRLCKPTRIVSGLLGILCPGSWTVPCSLQPAS